MRTIYARNTVADKIDNEIAQSFVEENHSQGASKANNTKTSIGLFFEEELVGVAQFCSPRTSDKKREYSTELLRLAFKKKTRVVGGASKLISFCIKKYNPADIFTYQDTTGQNTKIYEYCGFSKVSEDAKKEYLIAPSKTLGTADRKRKEILSLPYAVSLGPDAILGTKLGQVFNEDGSRKTNIELFLDLGWTIAETTGDKVYEWINPNLSFYTYKITATDSDKYYYGVSSVKKPFSELTFEDCLNDGYYGSGGNTLKNNKFVNWKKKHKENLRKEIIELFERKAHAYNAEKKLIDDLWKTDKSCMNSAPGGLYLGFGKGWREGVSIKRCEIHGETKHRGKACYKCFMNELVTEQECSIHGLTKFQGESCSKCAVGKTFSEKVCEIHGLTKFSGKYCRKCTVSKTVSMKECKIHGLTKHQGDVCNSCNALSSISFKVCEIHGETKHTGDRCCKCISAANNTMKDCRFHGLSNHRGEKCMKCSAQKGKHSRGLHTAVIEPLCFLCE